MTIGFANFAALPNLGPLTDDPHEVWGDERGVTGIAVTPQPLDSDGDGLMDTWERFGLDADCDPATAALPLPTWGADPLHKDLFLELDFCAGAAPSRATVQSVIEAFAAAPIDAGGTPNPDGRPGINLRVDTGSLREAGMLVGSDFGGGNAIACPTTWIANLNGDSCPLTNVCVPTGVDTGRCSVVGNECTPDNGFYTLGKEDFHPHPMTGLPTPNFDPARRLVFRYGLQASPFGIATTPMAAEDGVMGGTCFDNIDNKGKGADARDAVCAALSEDPGVAPAGSCYTMPGTAPFDDDLDMLPDDADPDCMAGLEDGAGPGSCFDGLDNVSDGADGADPDCNGIGGNEDGAGAGSCGNGLDDGSDGTDATDPECDAVSEDPAAAMLMFIAGTCFNGMDDDGDNFQDDQDPDCRLAAEDGSGPGSCFDGMDNGSDGTDGTDSECNASTREDGLGPCFDGVDNVIDGADVLDPECFAREEVPGVSGAGSCYSPAGMPVDDDMDGLRDEMDPDCAGATEDGSIANSCFDGIENAVIDGTDGADADCRPLSEDNAGPGSCFDGKDNFLDGADAEDPDCGQAGGWGEQGGNDLVLYNTDPASLMHELGHLLDLDHGGGDSRNCKPNYVSVMNYDHAFGISQVLGSGAEGPGRPPGSCGDFMDNNGDTRIDGIDPACRGIDSDGDGIGDNQIIDYSPARFPGGRAVAPLMPLAEGHLFEATIFDATDVANTMTFVPFRPTAREGGGGAGSCYDGRDNALDGTADFGGAGLPPDPDCNAGSEDGIVAPAGMPSTCSDGIDNMGDGADIADPECLMAEERPGVSGAGSCYTPVGMPVDDDGDGLPDGADPDCQVATEDGAPAGSCLDNIDNRSDGADAADPDCQLLSEDNAGPGSCGDGIDTDMDGLDDASDPDCSGVKVLSPVNGDVNRDGVPDGVDWDSDGLFMSMNIAANIDTADAATQLPQICANTTVTPAVVDGADENDAECMAVTEGGLGDCYNQRDDDADGSQDENDLECLLASEDGAGPGSCLDDADNGVREGFDDWQHISLPFVQFGDSNDGPVNPSTDRDPNRVTLIRMRDLVRTTDIAIDAPAEVAPLGGVAPIDLIVQDVGTVDAYGPVRVVVKPSTSVTLAATGSVCSPRADRALVCEFDWLAAGEARALEVTASVNGCGAGEQVLVRADNLGGPDPKQDSNEAIVRLVDGSPPVITAPSYTIQRCAPEPALATINASVEDDCTPPANLNFSGRLVSVNGHAVPGTVAINGLDLKIVLPVGVSVIEWSATDEEGNHSSLTQAVTVALSDEPAVCCAPGEQVITGTSSSNLLWLPFWEHYCMFGKGGADSLITGPQSDLLSGGNQNDFLSSGSTNDKLLGGSGDDWIEHHTSGARMHAGAGNDLIEVTIGGVSYGNAGNDHIFGGYANDTIYPGPGSDVVVAGLGNDTVVLYDTCEVTSSELLDGGFGQDTLITPVPVTQLIAMGVVVYGFDTIIVKNDQRYLAECF
jgi:hypothetical protein